MKADMTETSEKLHHSLEHHVMQTKSRPSRRCNERCTASSRRSLVPLSYSPSSSLTSSSAAELPEDRALPCRLRNASSSRLISHLHSTDTALPLLPSPIRASPEPATSRMGCKDTPTFVQLAFRAGRGLAIVPSSHPRE